MKNLKTLKNRVRVVKNTKQITRALQMVSVSKMQKAQQMLANVKAYSDAILEIMREAGAVFGAAEADENRIYFEPKNTRAPALVVVFAPTRGFCGALVSSLQSFVYNFIKDPNYRGRSGLRAVGLQRKSRYILESLDDDIVDAIFEDPLDDVTQGGLEAEYTYIIDKYKEGKYSKIFLIYPEFLSVFSYKPKAELILPLSADILAKERKEDVNNKVFSVEPTPDEFFNAAIKRYLINRIMFAALNTKASEFSARTLAMKSATENAERLEQELQLEFNKVRQESITNELLDIVGALPKK